MRQNKHKIYTLENCGKDNTDIGLTGLSLDVKTSSYKDSATKVDFKDISEIAHGDNNLKKVSFSSRIS